MAVAMVSQEVTGLIKDGRSESAMAQCPGH